MSKTDIIIMFIDHALGEDSASWVPSHSWDEYASMGRMVRFNTVARRALATL